MAKLIVPKLVVKEVITALGLKPAGKNDVTEGLYDLFPKPSAYSIELVRTFINGKSSIVDPKNLPAVIKDLNSKYKKTKSIQLGFIAVLPMSQEVIMNVGGRKVKTQFLGMAGIYDWKSRSFEILYTGKDQITADEDRKTFDRFDGGLVNFAKDNKLRYVITPPATSKA